MPYQDLQESFEWEGVEVEAGVAIVGAVAEVAAAAVIVDGGAEVQGGCPPSPPSYARAFLIGCPSRHCPPPSTFTSTSTARGAFDISRVLHYVPGEAMPATEIGTGETKGGTVTGTAGTTDRCLAENMPRNKPRMLYMSFRLL
jgi:hypothetical protein